MITLILIVNAQIKGHERLEIILKGRNYCMNCIEVDKSTEFYTNPKFVFRSMLEDIHTYIHTYIHACMHVCMHVSLEK